MVCHEIRETARKREERGEEKRAGKVPQGVVGLGREVIREAERVGGFPRRDEGQLSKDRHR
jgi:COX assembly protein 1